MIESYEKSISLDTKETWQGLESLEQVVRVRYEPG